MNNPTLKYVKVRDVKDPEYGTPGSAGIDLYIPNDFREIALLEGDDALIPSGLKFDIPNGTVLTIFNKSGVATKKRLQVGACVDKNTKILTNKGIFEVYKLTKKFINENQIKIKGYDINKNEYNFYDFDGFKISNITNTIKIYFDNNTTLICSEDHMILTKNRGWVKALDLNENDNI